MCLSCELLGLIMLLSMLYDYNFALIHVRRVFLVSLCQTLLVLIGWQLTTYRHVRLAKSCNYNFLIQNRSKKEQNENDSGQTFNTFSYAQATIIWRIVPN